MVCSRFTGSDRPHAGDLSKRSTSESYTTAFLPSGHLDFESAFTAQNDEFKAVFVARLQVVKRLGQENQYLGSILTDNLVQCIWKIENMSTRVPDVVSYEFCAGIFPSKTLVNKAYYTCSGATISAITFGWVTRPSKKGRKNSWLKWDPLSGMDCIMVYFWQMSGSASEPGPGCSKPEHAYPDSVKLFNSISTDQWAARGGSKTNTLLSPCLDLDGAKDSKDPA